MDFNIQCCKDGANGGSVFVTNVTWRVFFKDLSTNRGRLLQWRWLAFVVPKVVWDVDDSVLFLAILVFPHMATDAPLTNCLHFATKVWALHVQSVDTLRTKCLYFAIEPWMGCRRVACACRPITFFIGNLY